MICVTGNERNAASLAQRLAANEHHPLQEVRLDLLETVDDTVYGLIERYATRLIVTCRGMAEG
ncbi:MAG: hypothetical protein ABIF77_19780, partial [bacterium]